MYINLFGYNSKYGIPKNTFKKVIFIEQGYLETMEKTYTRSKGFKEKEIKGLCGFLSPEGLYIPCEPWTHMQTATEILTSINPALVNTSDYKNERCLTEELGYVEFTSRGCIFKIRNYNKELRRLTSAQKDFLISNIGYSTTETQIRDIEFVLRVDTDLEESSVLSQVEMRYCCN